MASKEQFFEACDIGSLGFIRQHLNQHHDVVQVSGGCIQSTYLFSHV
jgi:hypothetical protein